MQSLAVLFLSLSLLFLSVHLATGFLVTWRLQHWAKRPACADQNGVSVIVPLCGLEAFSKDTLTSFFVLSHTRYELIFCVASEHDRICPLVKEIMLEYPSHESRLLIGTDEISANPKLNNIAKGYRVARFEWIAFVDSNVLAPADFLQKLRSSWRSDTGVVSAPPLGITPIGFWSELECAFLNAYELRWQYASDVVGNGFAQGKTMFFHRNVLEQIGFEALASEPAEDAATTKSIARLQLRARLALPSPQPLGRRSLSEVWKRQLRWAKLRRATFPVYFAPEIMTGALLPCICIAVFGLAANVGFSILLGPFLLLWYCFEIGVIHACGWPLSFLTLPALVARDMMIPILWLRA